jgi:hypothetical protein
VKKLNFYFRYVIKKSPTTTKMPSFKDELTATVNSVRKNIKTDAINCFINRLKRAMRWTAERGETKGAIALKINFYDEEEDEDEEYVVLRRLNDLLLYEEVKRRNDFEGTKIYEWLLKQIHKIGVFDDIYISLNIDNYEVEYSWDVDEE